LPSPAPLFCPHTSYLSADSHIDDLAAERTSLLRALVDLRLQLESDRTAAAAAAEERDALKTR